MVAAGWVGLTAGWLPRPAGTRHSMLPLAVPAAAAGLGYGTLLDLCAWPSVAPDAGIANLNW